MTSFPEFNQATTATEVANAFSNQIRGKNVLLVGVSPNSLGEHIALAIARYSPSLLILASRTLSKINEVITTIRQTAPNTAIKTVTIDLSSQASIRQAAKEIDFMAEKLDILINNAAVNVPNYETTKEGIEMHFGTNHIGLFLLTNLLLPKVIQAAEQSDVKGSTRIVNLTSAGHRLSPIRFTDYNFQKLDKDLEIGEQPPRGLPVALLDPKKSYSPYVAYGQSKTANILFSVSLTEALNSKGILSFSVHPGSIWTGLARNLDEEGRKLIKATVKVWKNGDQGAATAMVAAFDPKLNNVQDGYLADCQLAPAAEYATDAKIADRLWVLSEELVGEKFSLSKK